MYNYISTCTVKRSFLKKENFDAFRREVSSANTLVNELKPNKKYFTLNIDIL
jgi:hypothetical protein